MLYANTYSYDQEGRTAAVYLSYLAIQLVCWTPLTVAR